MEAGRPYPADTGLAKFFLKFTRIHRKWLWGNDLGLAGRGGVAVSPYQLTAYNNFEKISEKVAERVAARGKKCR